MVLFKIGHLFQQGPLTAELNLLVDSCVAINEDMIQLVLQISVLFRTYETKGITTLQALVISWSLIMASKAAGEEFIVSKLKRVKKKDGLSKLYHEISLKTKLSILAKQMPLYILLTTFRVLSMGLIITVFNYFSIIIYACLFLAIIIIGYIKTWKETEFLTRGFRSSVTTVDDRFSAEKIFQTFWFFMRGEDGGGGRQHQHRPQQQPPPLLLHPADEDLLGLPERSDSEADPGLLDTSSESMGSSRIDRIEQDLAVLTVSPEVGATQRPVSRHPQQTRKGRSEHLGRVAAALGGAGQQEETEEGHVQADSDGEDMAVSDLAPTNLASTGQPRTGPAASSFGMDIDLVELDTESSIDSVTELGGPGIGFDQAPVTPQPRFGALDLRFRVSAEELVRRSAAQKLARALAIKRKRPDHSNHTAHQPHRPRPHSSTTTPSHTPIPTITLDTPPRRIQVVTLSSPSHTTQPTITLPSPSHNTPPANTISFVRHSLSPTTHSPTTRVSRPPARSSPTPPPRSSPAPYTSWTQPHRPAPVHRHHALDQSLTYTRRPPSPYRPRVRMPNHTPLPSQVESRGRDREQRGGGPRSESRQWRSLLPDPVHRPGPAHRPPPYVWRPSSSSRSREGGRAGTNNSHPGSSNPRATSSTRTSMNPLTSSQGPSGQPSRRRDPSEVRGTGGGGSSSYWLCGHPPCSHRNIGRLGTPCGRPGCPSRKKFGR